jgi:hypothetical protein
MSNNIIYNTIVTNFYILFTSLGSNIFFPPTLVFQVAVFQQVSPRSYMSMPYLLHRKFLHYATVSQQQSMNGRNHEVCSRGLGWWRFTTWTADSLDLVPCLIFHKNTTFQKLDFLPVHLVCWVDRSSLNLSVVVVVIVVAAAVVKLFPHLIT